MIQCVELPPDTAAEFWSELAGYVEAALEYDITRSTTADEVRHQVVEGFARVLVCADGDAIRSATVLQIHLNNRSERVLHVICTAGSGMEEWLPTLLAKLDELAEAQECAAVTMVGRPGWARKLNHYGFKTEITHMRRATHGRNEQEQQSTTEPAAVNIASIR